MATTPLGDEALLAFFQSHPNLRARLASIVGAVENANGDLGEADAAEGRPIDEMRLLGREALQRWADKWVEATERDVRGQPGMHGPPCHVWTAPRMQEKNEPDGRIDCDHVSGLLTRRHDRWPRWGPRSNPKQ